MNYYFFWGPSMKKILGRYADLTGHMPMPPKWALGNQQSRWSYFPDTLAEEVVRRYRAEDLPLDVLHLDIDYMNGYRVFTWDRKRFPDPTRLHRQTAQAGSEGGDDCRSRHQISAARARRNRCRHEPRARRPRQELLRLQPGSGEELLPQTQRRQAWIGKVWPGKAVYADYTLTPPRAGGATCTAPTLDHGVAGIWNDMNEPSDFLDQTGKTQMDVVTYDGGANSPYAAEPQCFRAQRGARDLRRAGAAAAQRAALHHHARGLRRHPALLHHVDRRQHRDLGRAGAQHPDVPDAGAFRRAVRGRATSGGFIGRTDAELLTRWYQIAFPDAFLPQSRAD